MSVSHQPPTQCAGTNGPVPFANDPFRGPALHVTDDVIQPLSGPNWLSTALVDYLIQRSVPRSLPDCVLLGCATALQFFETMNAKTKDTTNRLDAKTARALKRQYQYYSFNSFQFIAANCTTVSPNSSHFFVIRVDFDVRRERIFQDVRVYDSLRRSGRHHESVNKNSIGAHFLRQLQLFLSQFAFFDAPGNEQLIRDPDLILAEAVYTSCPQQRNCHDCALFAFATLLHLVLGEEVTSDTFAQSHITSLRAGLHSALTHKRNSSGIPDARRSLSSYFSRSFFPRLKNKRDDDAKDDDAKDDNAKDDNANSQEEEAGSSDDDAYGDKSEAEDHSTMDESYNEMTNEDRTPDKIFEEMFAENSFEDLHGVSLAVDRYEQVSGYRIIIRRSEPYSRNYKCGSHFDCCFRAKFGKVRNQPFIALKSNHSVLYHCGIARPPRAADGRAYKKRVKGRLLGSVESVAVVKDAEPVPKDVMKAAANLDAFTTTYNQSFRAIGTTKSSKHKQDIRDFQLIVPYLEKLAKSNPGTTISWERNSENRLERFFVCPGIMRASLRFVRPVMSLDAAHLKSEWRGILYIASVKTGCDEIYPVAFAVMRDNENEEGWTWFLRNLNNALEVLVMDHPLRRVSFKYYTFISDRQKGLINALQLVFPRNHACFCAVHIRRNTQTNVGVKVADYVHQLATTFSKRRTTDWLSKIEEISQRGREYLEGIPPEQWRNVAWIDDVRLPPRFGILLSTNISEAANSMLEKARNGNWLECADSILEKMVERISTLREKCKGKHGPVEHIVEVVTRRWDACAGFRVVELEEGENRFTVCRPSRGRMEPSASYTIDVANCTCECGEWQNNGIPCEDAMAYFKLREELSLQYVLENKVHEYYMYSNQRELLKKNIVPVCIDSIAHDGMTLPPIPVAKRKSGRPKKKTRLRSNRSRFAHQPEKSNIVCGKCGERGHNVRTCLARKALASSREGGNGSTRDATHTTEVDLS